MNLSFVTLELAIATPGGSNQTLTDHLLNGSSAPFSLASAGYWDSFAARIGTTPFVQQGDNRQTWIGHSILTLVICRLRGGHGLFMH